VTDPGRHIQDSAQHAILVSKSRLFGLGLLGAKLAVVPTIFDASTDMPFVVPKAIVSHGLAYLLAATLLGLYVRFGSAFFVRSWLHVPVLAFLITSVVSTLFAVNTYLAVFGTHARMLGLAATLDFVVLYFSVVLLVRRRSDAVALVSATFAASCVVLGYEAVQIFGLDPYRWSIDSVERPFSSLGQATALAQYLIVIAMGAMTLGLFADGLRPSMRTLLVAFAGILLLGAAATGTRSALLGLGAGSALLVLLVWRSHPSRWARAISLAGAVTASAALAALLLFSPLGARFAATIGDAAEEDDGVAARFEPSAVGRLALYEIGLDIVRERPLFGYGPDNFVVGVPRYRPEQAPEIVRQSLASSAHSWVVQVLTSTGIAGLVSFTSIALVAIALAFRAGFRPGAIAGAVMLGSFLGTGLTTVNEFGTEWLFWLSAGGIAASVAASTGVEIVGRDRASRRTGAYWNSSLRRSAGVILLGVALLSALAGASALGGSSSARASQVARLAGQTNSAVQDGLQATRADPGRAEYWHVLGLAFVAAQRWREAIAAFDYASKLAPHDSRYVGDHATANLILATNGDSVARAMARELGQRAVRIDPNNPRAHLTRAVVMQFVGELPQAVNSIERALYLDPQSTNESLYVAATQIMLSSGRPKDAVRLARDGLAIAQTAKAAIEMRIDLARGLLALGQREDALMELEIVLENQPGNRTAQELRAQILANPPG
jgi:O-antigen ligase/tetratricopeptide (TPR) repeat protein